MEPGNSTPPPTEDAKVHVGRDVSGQVAIGEHITQIGDVRDAEITIGQRVTNFIFGSVEQQRAERNRRTMLQLVRNTWIAGVLEQSLHGAAMIELGLEERAEAVEHPWEMVLRASGEPSQPLPPSTQIADIFDRMDRALLILGAPGSGKTTMLLELARHMIARAEEDPTQPIPVVFNLSSWAEKRQPIAEWLVEELNAKYHVRKTTARAWVAHDELLLLLDGLDEVREEHREGCVQAINDFRRECGVPVAICSRVADYEALTDKLDLRGAVLLQPLKPEQVEAYLDRAGDEMASVREVWRTDPVFQELVQSPLMLSVALLAYQGTPVEELRLDYTVEERRKHLFNTYMERMFERPREVASPCTQEQAIHWLGWLAWQMTAHAQAVFLIEGLQPDWLPVRVQRRARVVARLVVGLLGMLVGVLVGGLIDVCFVLLYGEMIPLDVRIVGMLVDSLVDVLSGGLRFGLIGGLVGGLVGVLVGKLETVETVEALRWSLRGGFKGSFVGLAVGLVVGPVFVLVFGLVAGLPPLDIRIVGVLANGGLRSVLDSGLRSVLDSGLGCMQIFWLNAMLVGGLLGGLVGGLGYVELKATISPNQGVRRSARNGFINWLVGVLGVALVVVLDFVLVVVLRVWLVERLVVIMIIGLVFLLVGALVIWLVRYSGSAVILHPVLRAFLHRHNSLPWRVVPFLDYCAERILLRKVGGGYIFVHRLVQEYFASLYEEGVA